MLTPRTMEKKKTSSSHLFLSIPTGLVGILPKLWEKDLHRIITGWANEFGPVFKLRVMQFHVSKKFSCFFLLFFFFLLFRAASRLPPLLLSQPLLAVLLNLFSLSLSLSLF